MYASPCTRAGRQFDAPRLGLGKGAIPHHHSKWDPDAGNLNGPINARVSVWMLPAMLRALQ
jgi:hypothetical protein